MLSKILEEFEEHRACGEEMRKNYENWLASVKDEA